MSNQEQALREGLAKRRIFDEDQKICYTYGWKDALALPADAAEPREESYPGQSYFHAHNKNIRDSEKRATASPSAVLTEEQVRALIAKWYEQQATYPNGHGDAEAAAAVRLLEALLSALAQPTTSFSPPHAPPSEQEKRNESWKEHWKKVNEPTAAKDSWSRDERNPIPQKEKP